MLLATSTMRSLLCALSLVVLEAFAPQGAPRLPVQRFSDASANEVEFTRQEALYDLVYVERLAPPQTSAGGACSASPFRVSP